MKWTKQPERERESSWLGEFLRVNGNPPACLQTSETGSEGTLLCECGHALAERAKEPRMEVEQRSRYPLFQPFRSPAGRIY